MTKINNQSNSLDSIEFVQDISPETAANYSGGADFVFGGGNIILHKDPNGQGQSLGINSSIGEDINIGLFPTNGRETTFNDTVSSITINDGIWQLYTDEGLKGDTTGALPPGTYNLGANDDAITSIIRVG
jgi:hypothetical protein